MYDLAGAEFEIERVFPIDAGVELFAVGFKPAGVVHDHLAALGSLDALTLFAVDESQTTRVFGSVSWDFDRFGHFQQLHLEHQIGTWRNGSTCTALAVTQLGGDKQLAFPAFFHALNAFIPTRDDTTGAEVKIETFLAVEAGIEFVAVGLQPAGVVHFHC